MQNQRWTLHQNENCSKMDFKKEKNLLLLDLDPISYIDGTHGNSLSSSKFSTWLLILCGNFRSLAWGDAPTARKTAPPSSASVYNVYDGCGCLLLMAHPFRKVTWVLWEEGWTLVRGSLTSKYQEKGFRKSALKRGMGGPSSGVPWYKRFTKISHFFFLSFFTFFSLSFCFVFWLSLFWCRATPPPPPTAISLHFLCPKYGVKSIHSPQLFHHPPSRPCHHHLEHAPTRVQYIHVCTTQVLISDWILTSHRPHRVTSGWLNSVIIKCIFHNSSCT